MGLSKRDCERLGIGHLYPSGASAGRRPAPAPVEPARPAAPSPPGRWVMTIPGWRPALDNEIMRGHRKGAHSLKSRDVAQIAAAALAFGVPKASRRRRVKLTIRNRYGSFPDDTAPYQSFLDALVRNGLLVDDSRRWCTLEFPPTFERGPKETVIELEDIADPEAAS